MKLIMTFQPRCNLEINSKFHKKPLLLVNRAKNKDTFKSILIRSTKLLFMLLLFPLFYFMGCLKLVLIDKPLFIYQSSVAFWSWFSSRVNKIYQILINIPFKYEIASFGSTGSLDTKRTLRSFSEVSERFNEAIYILSCMLLRRALLVLEDNIFTKFYIKMLLKRLVNLAPQTWTFLESLLSPDTLLNFHTAYRFNTKGEPSIEDVPQQISFAPTNAERQSSQVREELIASYFSTFDAVQFEEQLS